MSQTAWSSSVRVNSLGITGLVADEEVDFTINPAYLNFIDGQRVYGALSASWRNEYQGTNSNRVDPSVSWVASGGTSKYALSANGDFQRNSPFDTAVSYTQDGSLGFSWAKQLSQGKGLGVHVDYESTRFRSDDSHETHGFNWKSNVGLLYGDSEGHRLGMDLSGTYNKGDFELSPPSGASGITEGWSVTAAIRPESGSLKGKLRRSVLSVGYNRSWSNEGKSIDWSIPHTLGLGWQRPGNDGRLWLIGAEINGDYSQSQTRYGAYNNTSVNWSEWFSTKIGLEQPLNTGRWILRTSLIPVFAEYFHNSSSSAGRFRSTNYSLGLISGYDVGVGFNPTENFSLDALFSSNNVQQYVEKTSFYDSSSRRKATAMDLSVAATWKF